MMGHILCAFHDGGATVTFDGAIAVQLYTKIIGLTKYLLHGYTEDIPDTTIPQKP